MSWHPVDAGELFGAMAKKPAKPRHTPAKTSTPAKGSGEQKSPTLRSHAEAERKRIEKNARTVKAAHRDRDYKIVGNGIDTGAVAP
jgi:hypothetical protein